MRSLWDCFAGSGKVDRSKKMWEFPLNFTDCSIICLEFQFRNDAEIAKPYLVNDSIQPGLF